MADIIADVEQEVMGEVMDPPAVLPINYPKLKVDTKQITDLPEAKQREYHAKIAQALAQEDNAISAATSERELAKLPPSVRVAKMAAEAAQMQAALRRQSQSPMIEVEDDREPSDDPGLSKSAAKAMADKARHITRKAEQEESAPERVDTGVKVGPATCPHCLWDLSMPAVAEPSAFDKSAFVQCLLGEKPFTKTYNLFGGNVRLTLRTLTTPEADACFKEAQREERIGKITSQHDFYERANRFRAYLQVQRLESANQSFDHDLPDGLDTVTNPNASAYWRLPEEVVLSPDETPLPWVEEYVMAKVLRTETLVRSVLLVCRNFNRLCAKMEALVDNTDFWNGTAAA
jgi:hypothetical protein